MTASEPTAEAGRVVAIQPFWMAASVPVDMFTLVCGDTINAAQAALCFFGLWVARQTTRAAYFFFGAAGGIGGRACCAGGLTFACLWLWRGAGGGGDGGSGRLIGLFIVPFLRFGKLYRGYFRRLDEDSFEVREVLLLPIYFAHCVCDEEVAVLV